MNNSGHDESISWRPQSEKSYANLPGLIFRWKFPHFIRLPTSGAKGQGKRRHRDILGRVSYIQPTDGYLSPCDGHLAKLVVQCSQDVWDHSSKATWRRTFIRNQSPPLVRLAFWPLQEVAIDGKLKSSTIALVCVRWILASLGILILLAIPVSITGSRIKGGKYDAFPFKTWTYAYDAKNKLEDKHRWNSNAESHDRNQTMDHKATGVIERAIEPNYLCFLTGDGRTMEIKSVPFWRQQHGPDTPTDYVFVSYTSTQFGNRDLFLHEVGQHAAKAAGVAAYWVGCSCLGSEVEVPGNVWRIGDIIRNAHSMVIAVSATPEEANDNSVQSLLQNWGKRVWTWPEILLSPANTQVSIYVKGRNLEAPTRMQKRSFPALWEDARLSGRLIDHYEGTQILTPLEFVTTALRCLHKRETKAYLPGDMSYALMSLLRQRPNVVREDSAFQAFARLSLANDSDQLLERLICVLPRSPDDLWHELEDQWGVSLWDIYPRSQVCGIGDDDTVILDGVRGAAIRWKAFTKVTTLNRETLKRTIARLVFRSTFMFVVGGSICVAVGGAGDEPIMYVGIGFLSISLLIALLSPYLIRLLYFGKVWGAEPWLFGFEGYMDLDSIERHIFGTTLGYMKWSAAGSPLSRHEANDHNECIGMDPIRYSDVKARIHKALTSDVNEEKIFTLVDTATMTVTLFSASRPPVAAIICGEEGGMQRAVLCSYNWDTQTVYRETVLRMETPVYEKMRPIARIRFGLQRKFPETV